MMRWKELIDTKTTELNETEYFPIDYFPGSKIFCKTEKYYFICLNV